MKVQNFSAEKKQFTHKTIINEVFFCSVAIEYETSKHHNYKSFWH